MRIIRTNRCPHGRIESFDAIWEPGDSPELPAVEHCPLCQPDAVDLSDDLAGNADA